PRKSTAEERLAAAYERELQAIASPIGIQAENGSSAAQTPKPISSSDAFTANALMNGLAQPQTTTNTPGQRHAAIGNAEVDDPNLQSRKEAFLASARRAAPDDYLNSTRTKPLSKYEI